MATMDSKKMAVLTNNMFYENACSSDTSSMYPITTCHWAGKTPYCEVILATSPTFGKVLFLDNEIQSAEADEAIYHEHLVHPVMTATLAARRALRVLIVGGGEGATAREVLRYASTQVEAVDWVDIDSALVGLCRRHLEWANDGIYNDRRLRYIAADIRVFLQQATDETYDVIILDLPDPDVAELKEQHDTGYMRSTALYSKTFWRALCAHLTPGGAIVSHAGPVAPGENAAARRAGLTWIQEVAKACGMGEGTAYHAPIPSFQSEWGFWMSAPAPPNPVFPTGLRVLDAQALQYACTWPKYWTTLK